MQTNSTVFTIDTATNLVVANIDTPDYELGINISPDDLAITPDGKHLYITDVSTHSVLVADTATYTISAVLPVSIAGGGAIAIVSAQ